MGILSVLGLAPKQITAQKAPAIIDVGYNGFYGMNGMNNTYSSMGIDLLSALSVPSVAKCTNLICGTVGAIPLQMFKKSTGAKLPNPVWVDQPQLNQPRNLTIALITRALMFYGVAYLQVKEIYYDDQRPARFEWVDNLRVSVKTNQYNTEVDYYMINNIKLPMSGVGSLVTIQHSDTYGILARGGRTIQAAIDIERATNVSANSPMPTGIIRNTGADLPETQIQGLLSAFKSARQNRSTAYLTSTLQYEAVAFSPKDMTYNDSAQFLATQISRLCNVSAYFLSADMNSSMTYSSVLNERKAFVSQTLMPYFESIQSRFSMDDLTPRGTEVLFAIDDTYLKADPIERLLVIEKMLALQLITLDQAKAMEPMTNEGSGDITI